MPETDVLAWNFGTLEVFLFISGQNLTSKLRSSGLLYLFVITLRRFPTSKSPKPVHTLGPLDWVLSKIKVTTVSLLWLWLSLVVWNSHIRKDIFSFWNNFHFLNNIKRDFIDLIENLLKRPYLEFKMGNCCAIPERNSPNDEIGDQKTRHRHRHQHNNRPKHRHRHRHRHHRNGLKISIDPLW